MARIAVFASGNGSNFQVLAEKFKDDPENEVVFLLYNRKAAYVKERAAALGIRSEYVNYVNLGVSGAEDRIISLLHEYSVDIVFLAGFMRVLSAGMLKRAGIPIINIHPSLLPLYKGEHAIEQAWNSGDERSGISIHYVNEEVDGGEIITSQSLEIDRSGDIDSFEEAIHALEHKWYPRVAYDLCNRINRREA
jgi:phosphoribosylglycinamide formyltransferase-1